MGQYKKDIIITIIESETDKTCNCCSNAYFNDGHTLTFFKLSITNGYHANVLHFCQHCLETLWGKAGEAIGNTIGG